MGEKEQGTTHSVMGELRVDRRWQREEGSGALPKSLLTFEKYEQPPREGSVYASTSAHECVGLRCVLGITPETCSGLVPMDQALGLYAFT